MSYQKLFAALWENYTDRNPHALKVYELFTKKGEEVINDHVAFRTFNDPRVNVDALAKFFIKYGYVEKGTYEFPVKKLFAKHYEHPDAKAPKVFISELLIENFSKELQHIAKVCVEAIPNHLFTSEKILTAGAVWQPLRYKTYKDLLAESEYAAWLYAFGFCPNHFTVNVNALQHFKELNDVNEFLLLNGFKLNTSGGAIKGTPQECLEQSSTLAGEIEVKFIEGKYNIPSCYYEFAKRYPLPSGEMYTGFIAASADKIFESTDVNSGKN